MLSDEHLIQAMMAVGMRDRNVVYVSVPITSGQREVDLMRKVGAHSAGELRDVEPDLWRHNVLQANEVAALTHVEAVRRAPWVPGGFVVVDPSRMSITGWDQDDYNGFWVRLMTEHVRFLVATPGWEYSRGARTEVGYALTFDPADLQVVDEGGTPIHPDELRERAASVCSTFAEMGWSVDEAQAYLPPLAERRPTLVPSAQSQTFNWLVAERRFQVRHFGSERDDRRLVESGLERSGWWHQQLDEYLRRAQAGPLAQGSARTDLAKFAATAVALLESAIRVHGPVPRPRSKQGDPDD